MAKPKSSPTDPSRPSRAAGEDEGERTQPKPGTITSIQSQVRDPERVSVFIDGAFGFGLARDVAEEFGLHQDQVLDESALAGVLAREELHKATRTALNFLAYRPRSEGEIRRRLRQGQVPEPTIDLVLDKLRDWRYVDDADFARRWIANRGEHRPRGSRLLAQELRAKGVAPEVSAEALDEAGIDEQAGALDIARKRARQLAALEQPIRERRLSGFLARRGYGFDIIRTTLNTLRDEAGEDEQIEPG